MPGIKVRENEGFDSAIRRFKRLVEKSGVLSKLRQLEFFEPPSEKKKRAKAAAIKRFRKKQMRDFRGQRNSVAGRGASSRRTSNSSRESSRNRDRDN